LAQDQQHVFHFLVFTPLESASIYAGDVRNRKHQILIEGRVKELLFLTGVTSPFTEGQWPSTEMKLNPKPFISIISHVMEIF
jgi:hypothetical protein